MGRILFIHQSADLYGSDKTLLVLVQDFQKSLHTPIVVLPEYGPLYDALEESGVQVWIMPVIKISRKMFTIKNLFLLPFQVVSALIKLNKKAKGIDLIYSNTLAVLLGFIFAKLKRKKHIWHIHEIIKYPPLVTKIFGTLISSKTNTAIIFNSEATKKYWEEQINTRTINSFCVWNGLDKPPLDIMPSEVKKIRSQDFDAKENDIVFGLVGRINRLKGHHLLLEAFENILEKHKNIKLIFVGSPPPNQDEYLTNLIDTIKTKGLTGKVKILPFQKNIWEIWQSLDVAVVPSTEPESFGLVAIEAMLCKKPVIASDFGGLKEIVVNKETGLLFEPSNQKSLANAMQFLIDSSELRQTFGNNGYERAIRLFTLKEYTQKIKSICEKY